MRKTSDLTKQLLRLAGRSEIRQELLDWLESKGARITPEMLVDWLENSQERDKSDGAVNPGN